jgi:hypothetical protein
MGFLANRMTAIPEAQKLHIASYPASQGLTMLCRIGFSAAT